MLFKEEEVDLQRLPNFFGEKITDYVIVVFTGGDYLEDNDETLVEFLGNSPKPLKASLKNYSALLDYSVFGLSPPIILSF